MVKAVIFDCFGVLTDQAWNTFIDRLPESADMESITAFNRAYDSGIISKQEFFTGASEATGQDPKYIESFFESGDVKNDALLEYIGELKGRGFKIGLISNIATNWVRDTLLNSTEQKLFDDMVMSFEVGMTKPDPRIFRLACDRLGVEPVQAIFIDDNQSFCMAASDEGMQAIEYSGFSQAQAAIEETITLNS